MTAHLVLAQNGNSDNQNGWKRVLYNFYVVKNDLFFGNSTADFVQSCKAWAGGELSLNLYTKISIIIRFL